MKIRIVNYKEIEARNYKPEPHTVTFRDYPDGEYWALLDDNNEILSLLRISEKHGGIYFSEVYTPPEFRCRGYCTVLIDFLANAIYKDSVLIAHCLKASVKCFQKAGFKHYNTRNFKYGTQYFMRRE